MKWSQYFVKNLPKMSTLHSWRVCNFFMTKRTVSMQTISGNYALNLFEQFFWSKLIGNLWMCSEFKSISFNCKLSTYPPSTDLMTLRKWGKKKFIFVWIVNLSHTERIQSLNETHLNRFQELFSLVKLIWAHFDYFLWFKLIFFYQ